MRVHKREAVVRDARLGLMQRVSDWLNSAECEALTDAEFVQVLNGVMSDQLQSWAKYAIRSERHPDDPDHPGGLE